ncbi:MAG: prolipoprotein diacylglyceryl transferase [Chloroflexi bacterium]|nr:prolipoprotein diacylglyceryl transferase [Chloroflexota bacterium]
MFDAVPNPVALQLGPLTIGWYGLGYAIGLAAAYVLLSRLARRAGEDPDILGNGMVIVVVAALIGGRAYHVIDRWNDLYKDHLLSIVLPPYSGLGVYGGIITGTIAAYLYARRRGVSFLRWADIIAPALFLMQSIGRWGNYFNQELYGSPTDLPWGIPIDAAHRVADFPVDLFPVETTRFHPLFLYESISGIVGMLVLLFIGARFRSRLRPGDLLLMFFVWYGLTRFVLEALRHGNWLFFGVPTAQLVSAAFIAVGLALLAWRHRPGHPNDDPPSRPSEAVWGAAGGADWRTRRTDESWAHLPGLGGDRPADTTPENLGIGPPEPDREGSRPRP